MNNKINIAFVKYCGLATGGTEKWLQTIAANLPENIFTVDFFYCDASPYIGSDYKHPDTDLYRLEYMLSKKHINLIKFNVGAKNVTIPTHDWVNTNFWDLFDETKYDLVITGRAGHKEYPYYLIKKTPIIEFVTLPGMADNQSNIYKSVHISKFQADTWLRAGGLAEKLEIVPLFSELPKRLNRQEFNIKRSLKLSEKQFVFGMHQRPDDGIFSQVPLMAYSELEKKYGDNVCYLLMGGSNLYKLQAKELGLKYFYNIPESGDYKNIMLFLNTLDAYAHGRKDGETFSLAIAEALYCGLPIISHIAPAMGHLETIGNAGAVASSLEEYVAEMNKLISDDEYHQICAKNAENRFNSELSLEVNMQKVIQLIENVYNKRKNNEKMDQQLAPEFWEDMWN